MAFTKVSTGYQYAVGTSFEGLEDIRRRKHAGTHQANKSDTGGVLHSADPGKVRTGVRAPVACECDDLGLKLLCHVNSTGRTPVATG